ncbi:MAG: cytochrome P450, partial [Nakamurella sp.]
ERGETSFTAMDPPDHTHYRKLLTKHFTVKRIAALRPAVEAIVADLIEKFSALPQPADLVQQLAYPIATRTMCHLIGVPYTDHEWFQERAEVRSVMDADPADAAQATQDLLDYVDTLIGLRLDNPQDDLLSKLTHELVVTGVLTRSELVAIVRLLLTAGHETTATMIGTGTFVLLSHPDQLAELRADSGLDSGVNSGLLQGAVEELLRYISMLHITVVRRAKAETELGGQRICAGDGLIANPAAANKDPDAFADPDTFDIHRDARHHVAFGFGVHQCLGQPVARLELQAVFGTLFSRLPNLRLAIDADEVDFNNSNLVGVRSLPVCW